MSGRYEFRVFGTDLEFAHRALDKTLPALGTETLCDVYLLTHDPRQSFKLRGGNMLELKCLRGCSRGFQRWVPAGCVRLPATGQQIAGGFSTWAELPDFTTNQLHDVSDVQSAFRRIGSREVVAHKCRTKYGIEPGQAEHVHLTVDESLKVETIAVEGFNITRLSQVLVRIGLGGRPNVSYPEFLVAG